MFSDAQARNRLNIALIAALMVIAVVARLIPGPRTIDDAFITFRYSRNLVEGQGFVYNPGVHTLGTTTPLFTLLMALVSALLRGQDFQWYAIAASAMADAATVALLFLLTLRLTGSRVAAVIPALLWAISPYSVTFAVGGMETSVVVLWLVAATWAFVTGRDRLLGLFAALGLLTRIDTALWVGLIFLFQWLMLLRCAGGPLVRRVPWATWIICALVMLPWLIFSAVYFGSPLPNSVSAKTVAYIMPPFSALKTFIPVYSTPFQEFETVGAVGSMVAAVVYLTLSLFGLFYAARRLPKLLPFLLYPWLYVVVFALANPLVFRWYLAPPLPALIVGLVAGAWMLLEQIGGLLHSRRLTLYATALVGLIWLAFSLNGWTLRPDHAPDRPAPKMAWHEIEILYQQVGTELREKYGVTPDTRVASADIGAIGYFSRATIIDTVGLVTPELRRYYPLPPGLIADGQNYAIPPQLIDDARPAYLVTMEAFVRLGLEKDPAFKQDYTLLYEIPTIYYGTGMRLYQIKAAS
jgi:4-amino-4-deoxy-L-arabinose transferase-like glycosyltransferase